MIYISSVSNYKTHFNNFDDELHTKFCHNNRIFSLGAYVNFMILMRILISIDLVVVL